MGIKHSEDVFGTHEAYVFKVAAANKVAVPEIPSDLSDLNVIAPYVNRGRWIIDCPSQNCYEAYFASREKPFYCYKCGNRDNEGAYYRVQFPLDKTDIERTLDEREFDDNKNWDRSEKLEDLKLETRFRGVKSLIDAEKAKQGDSDGV